MKTKVRIKKSAEKILSCTGRKIVRYTTIFACTMLMCSCAKNEFCVGSEAHESSWSVYCNKYGVDAINPSEEQEDYYLDCYVGSVEEECDMKGCEIPFCSDNVCELINVDGVNFIVYCDSTLNLDHEMLCVDEETMRLIEAAKCSQTGKLTGYLRMNFRTQTAYCYNHE